MTEETELANKKKRALKALTESEGWAILCEMVCKQRKMRENQIILTPINKDHTVLKQEYIKGECAAFRLVEELPAQLIEGLEAEIEDDRNDEPDDNDGTGDADAGADDGEDNY